MCAAGVEPALRSVINDGAENSYGVIINPPVPFTKSRKSDAVFGRYLAPLAALGAGLALAPLLKALQRRPDGPAR